jgi:hypothetical protein
MRPIYNSIFKRGESTNQGSNSKSNTTGLTSYPKLRPTNNMNDTWVSHNNFERLGPSDDEASLEMTPLKQADGSIMVTKQVDQRVTSEKHAR